MSLYYSSFKASPTFKGHACISRHSHFKATPTFQGHTHISKPHPHFKATPTFQGHTHISRKEEQMTTPRFKATPGFKAKPSLETMLESSPRIHCKHHSTHFDAVLINISRAGERVPPLVHLLAEDDDLLEEEDPPLSEQRLVRIDFQRVLHHHQVVL